MYCIYADRDVAEENGNYDHIFPLALGGTNQFQVWSDEQLNSRIGTEVDGALVSDPLIELALQNSGVKGHNKRPRTPRWKRSTLNGEPIQVTLQKEEILVWDAKQNRELSKEEISGQEITSILRIGQHTCLRFVAKVVLAGGYFLYSDEFRSAVNCDHLRSLVFLDIEQLKTDNTFANCEIKFCDRFHPDSRDASAAGIYRTLCEYIHRSLFIAIPHHSSISFHVGVVGAYIGSMIVPAKTDRLPIDGEHDLGHCIVLGPGNIERTSHRHLLQDFLRAIEERAND
ncbi:MAG: hypothetical protein OXF79_27515 [Chloroflexi bacterium]|nr:hypothetical protein [Chloroflexota bacterium]